MNVDFDLVRRALSSPATLPDAYPRLTGDEPAAVLVLLTADPLAASLHVRASSMREHAGEIALPGGRRDPGDASLLATALRETREELGVDEGEIEALGELFPVPVVTGKYLIHPFVGLTRARARAASPEIERLLSMPLAPYVLGERAVYYRMDRWRGSTFPTPFFKLPSGEVPYGATAAILVDLLRRLAACAGTMLSLIESSEKPWGDRYAKEGA